MRPYPPVHPCTLGILPLWAALVGVTSLGAEASAGNAPRETAPATAASPTVIPGEAEGAASPGILEFAAEKGVITEGDRAVLVARFKGGVAVLNPGTLAMKSGVPVTVAPDGTTKYTLELTPAGGEPLRRSLRVEVVPPPRITSFRSEPAVVVRDDAATLYAVFENGIGVVEGDLGPLPGDGVERVTQPLNRDSLFLLTVTNRAGDSVTDSLWVKVGDPPPGPVITLKVAPETLYVQKPGSPPSGEAILTWDVKNAADVFIDHEIGFVAPTGVLVLRPENSMTYTFTAKDAEGRESTAQATLHVVPAPPPLPPP